MIPIVVGICVAGTYGLFELFARRKERLTIIEKIGDKLDASVISGKISYYSPFPKFAFGALKIGCLLTGMGLGMLVGFLINLSVAANGMYEIEWLRHDMVGFVYGSSVLLFGGIGLITAFVIQLKISRKKKCDVED
ncbi:MAG: hypothetical protein LBJ39_02390 [Tannerellaceae bacterium]|jgi:hypothetical protein|nr:hypothetical protein [Tannerellaceae bacterium]